MGEFFAMGKYGAYVWFAYGVTLLSLVLLFVWSWFGARSRDAELEQTRKWARAERRSPSSATLTAAVPAAANSKSDAGIAGGAKSMPATDAGSGA